jgi:hypothetical protein
VSRLEDKIPEGVSAADLDSLIGREENQRLELKETIDGTSVYELAKDLASLSNGGGGYLVIGAVEDVTTKKCSGFRSVVEPEPIRNRLKSVALQYIKERLPLSPEVRETSAGDRVILVPIRGSTRPRAVEFDGRTEYWKRFGSDKRQMSHSEVSAALAASDDGEEFKRQTRLLHDPSRWNEISKPEVLWRGMDGQFQAEVGKCRYLRLTMTPRELRDNRVNTSDQNLRSFLWCPTLGQRQNGWHIGMTAGQNPILSDSLGLRSQYVEGENGRLLFVRLTRSGHLELWVPVLPWLLPPRALFGNAEREESDLTLWPTAVIELPISFLRFAKELYRRVGINGEQTVRMEYRNLVGCFLPPGAPGISRFLEPSRRFPFRHFEPPETRLASDFDPDKTGFEMILTLYQLFGYDAAHIPFFVDGKFVPERWNY